MSTQGEVTGLMDERATGVGVGADVFSTFAKEGGRVGSGALGSGQGGVGRCV
ncbi:hypothetical protein ACFWIA_29170 [Streptomyces sp. NPDC127068]|jgi:hypothetical protein|uniref:hypothetical protein n=1 Tax=Streptomyces sp. NPDC127068 TaxID=3347127 RepID=UPI00365735E1